MFLWLSFYMYWTSSSTLLTKHHVNYLLQSLIIPRLYLLLTTSVKYFRIVLYTNSNRQRSRDYSSKKITQPDLTSYKTCTNLVSKYILSLAGAPCSGLTRRSVLFFEHNASLADASNKTVMCIRVVSAATVQIQYNFTFLSWFHVVLSVFNRFV